MAADLQCRHQEGEEIVVLPCSDAQEKYFQFGFNPGCLSLKALSHHKHLSKKISAHSTEKNDKGFPCYCLFQSS